LASAEPDKREKYKWVRYSLAGHAPWTSTSFILWPPK
jgi:hypothetical protein